MKAIRSVKEIDERIDQIEAAAPDFEAQHSLEDGLVWDVIYTIAHDFRQHDYPFFQALCTALIRSQDLNFRRECA